jgi:hypothetical protein
MRTRCLRVALLGLVTGLSASSEEPVAPGRLVAKLPAGVSLGLRAPVFSAGGKQVAFEGTKEGGGGGLFVGETLHDACDSADWYQFSPSSGELARVIVVDGRQKLLVGKEELCDSLAILFPEWTPDGSRVVFEAGVGDKEVVFDGAKFGAKYDLVREHVVSPDSAHVAYVAVRQGQTFAVLDGKENGPWDDVTHTHFSDKGGVLGFAARRGKTWRIVFNGKELPEHDSVSLEHGFSPDGVSIAYVAGDGGRSRVIRDGKEEEAHEGVEWELIYRKSPELLAYRAFDDGKFHVVVNGKPLGDPCTFLEMVCVSPDGSRFAWHGGEPEHGCLYLDGKKGDSWEAVSDLRFSPDSKSFAYVAIVEETYSFVLNGKVVGTGDAYGPSEFSPDSSTYSFGLFAHGEFRWVEIKTP